MSRCLLCFKPFVPEENFQTLFKPQKLCAVCLILLETPMQTSVLPLAGNEARIHTFDQKPHPALFHLIMRHVKTMNEPMIFLEKDMRIDQETTRLLSALFKPLNIFTATPLTLDELAVFLD